MAGFLDINSRLLPFQMSGYSARSATPYGDLERPRYLATDREPMGMVERGNINIMDRPSVPNPQGGRSTVFSMSFEEDGGRQVLVPLVTKRGTIDTPDQAVDRYRETGEHLGKFSTAEMADDYANRLHLQQEQMGVTARADAALAAFGYNWGDHP